MGILDTVEGLAGQKGSNANPQMAHGIMQALDEHPGGLAGVLESFRNNGMDQHMQNWSSGQQKTASPEQIQQGLGNTGLIERVAQKSGVSPEIAKVAMAAMLSMVISHFTQGGQQAVPQSGFGGMASQVLGRFL